MLKVEVPQPEEIGAKNERKGMGKWGNQGSKRLPGSRQQPKPRTQRIKEQYTELKEDRTPPQP